MTLLKYKRLLFVILTIGLASCSNPWDGRENSGDVNLNVTLNEAITKTPETTEFGKLLAQTGYDKILAASKTYTVFVPTNEAMKAVDATLLSNPDALKKFVANHIALTSFSSVRNVDEVRIKMLSDKFLTFKGSASIGEATIITADRYAANGVFHIINKALTPKLNIWEYVNSKASTSAMCNYLVSLKGFNIYKADADAKINLLPGFLSDSLSNSYLKNVYNLNNEKNSYTLFLMEDGGYNGEVDKMKPYLIKGTADSTAIYSSYFTLRDLVVPKAYKKEELPTTLFSKFGVQFDVDKTQIVGEPIVLSNGIVYLMKKVDISLSNRLVTTKIEGEKNTSYLPNSPASLRNMIFYRDNKDASGVLFNDIMVKNSGVALFNLIYNAKDLYSTTYKVYWRAINDNQTVIFKQRLQIGGNYAKSGTVIPPIKLFNYLDVAVKVYDDVYVGDFALTKSGSIDFISLISDITASTTNGTQLSLDYLKFVPQVKP